jgi:uncharacterized protein
MKKVCFLLLYLTVLVQSLQAQRPVSPVNFSKVVVKDYFWKPRIERVHSATLPVCIDQTERVTPRMLNFDNAAARSGKHKGIYFDDSDVYKVIEGIAYTLKTKPDSALEAKTDSWINRIAAAQLPDGYLNTYYTLTDLNKRWTDMEKHEDYCLGHLIEGAIAYFDATSKRKLLDVSIRFANHFDSTFRMQNRPWVTGHQELELALVKLYHTTQNDRYLKLAEWLLDQRGRGFGKGRIWEDKKDFPEGAAYCQDDAPVRQITDIKGHAVRAMYLYTGMADVAAETGDRGYTQALERVWEDVVGRNMYITGGIGSSTKNEGFTQDYDLPNESAYCETCASVGMVFWNQRMNLYSGDAKYIDVLERSLYNGALAGVQLTGNLFFYVNPLASMGMHHRRPWYGTACCPSNVSRLMPSVGGYVYSTSANALWINLYVGSETEVQLGPHKVKFAQQTNYPWSGEVQLKVTPDSTKADFEVKLRIPAWCDKYTVEVNGKPVENLKTDKGYLTLARTWMRNDVVKLRMLMPVKVIAADPRVKANAGKRAIQRGPLVYCVEEQDNRHLDFNEMVLSPKTQFNVAFDPNTLGGVATIKADNGAETFTLIPYYAWDNRQAGRMKVWLDWK